MNLKCLLRNDKPEIKCTKKESNVDKGHQQIQIFLPNK